MRRIGLVVNPAAGGGAADRAGALAHDELLARGFAVDVIHGGDLAEATTLTREAVVGGLDALVVVGGDGMVHLGVNAVAETSLPLGIVASGTGNDTARSLGLPVHDAVAAVAVIDTGLRLGPRRIDAGTVRPAGHSSHEWFAGIVSCGFDAAVNARTNELTWPGGSLRYVRGLLQELRVHRSYGYRITLDDLVWESAGVLVAVANAPRFGGGFLIAPDAQMDDGLLDVVLAGPATRTQLVSVLPKVLRGTHVGHPLVKVFRSRRVTVELAPHLGPAPKAAFADGERLGPLALEIEVRPGALRVLA